MHPSAATEQDGLSPSSRKRLETKLLFYFRKAIRTFQMIEPGDRILCALSGGKDSYGMTYLFKKWHAMQRGKKQWSFHVLSMDQGQPGWDPTSMEHWLRTHDIPYTITRQDTYSVVTEKIPAGKTYCSLCSRLRRGHIYQYAKTHGFNKIALGHHRDDLITTLLLSILYAGQIRSMPPKLLTDDQAHVVIRPLCFVQEGDLRAFAAHQQFPIIPCNLCGSQDNLHRQKVQQWIQTLAIDNPKIPSNILHALQSVQVSQLMDANLWDFRNLRVPSPPDSEGSAPAFGDMHLEPDKTYP